MNQYPFDQHQDNTNTPSPNKMAKMKWRNIGILLVILGLLILLPSMFLILSALIKVITSFTAEMISNFQQVIHTGGHTYSNDTEAFRLAKLCAALIFLGAIIKLIVDRRK